MARAQRVLSNDYEAWDSRGHGIEVGERRLGAVPTSEKRRSDAIDSQEGRG
jgi:hypothetical protein